MPTQERKILPDLEYLRECYTYNPDTGELSWKERPLHHFKSIGSQLHTNAVYAGTLVGVKRKQRKSGVTIYSAVWDCQLLRVIYNLHTGEEPPYIIDHKDGDPTKNRWDNLRPATGQQNAQNTLRRGYQITSNGTYRVRVRVDFGTFKTTEEAEAKYHEVVAKLHGEFYCGKVIP